ncbi:MAG: hypothetical protein KF901_14980 [Myxococcales bacterium]|nr:hypothetical protein [Myxococcales bacterium]
MLLAGCALALPFDDLEERGPVRCANGVDDDADGLVDCDDPDCDGECPETSSVACTNCRDDDGDGLVDHADPDCWFPLGPAAHVALSVEDERARCASTLGSRLHASPSSGEWQIEGTWEGDTVRLDGGPLCSATGGTSSDCGAVWTLVAARGGVCWTLRAELQLEESGSSVRIGLSQVPETLSAGSSILVGLRRSGESVEVGLSMPHAGAHETLAAGSGWVQVELRASPLEPSEPCEHASEAVLRLVARSVGSHLTLSRATDGALFSVPAHWSPDEDLHLVARVQDLGTVRLRGFEIDRERHDPCGYRFPQIEGDEGGPAIVLGVAQGMGRICVLGSTPLGPRREPFYEPARHHGSPPPPSDVGKPFASWFVSDRGLGSFAAAESPPRGPFRSSALEGRHVRGGQLAWVPDEGFEAILLVSDEPERDGRLVRLTSPDCERWSELGFDDPSGAFRGMHPLLYEASNQTRRLVLGEPGEGYCCSQRVGSRDEECFCGEADTRAFVKPTHVPCWGYPRGRLVEVTSEDGARWTARSSSSLPAMDRWSSPCGGLGPAAIPAEESARNYPVEVRQLCEVGGRRLFVGSSTGSLKDPSVGVELVMDLGEGTGRSPLVVDGRRWPVSWLGANERLGTFDAARVSEPQVLWLGHHQGDPRCAVEALLFYRGFHEVRHEHSGLSTSLGGAVGVLPVRIERAREERVAPFCRCNVL